MRWACINAGIPGLQPGVPATWGIPNFSFTRDPYSGIGDSTDGPYVTKDPDKSINDNFTWVKGKHSMDFGFSTTGRPLTRWAISYRAAPSSSRATPLRKSPPGKLAPKPAPASLISCSASFTPRPTRCRSRRPITSSTSRPSTSTITISSRPTSRFPPACATS